MRPVETVRSLTDSGCSAAPGQRNADCADQRRFSSLAGVRIGLVATAGNAPSAGPRRPFAVHKDVTQTRELLLDKRG